MSGTFFGFNTALKGLYAQQKAMNTTAHNISNADTPGYTRQQAIMAADFAFPVPSMNKPGGAGQVGTGVNVTEIRRIRDVFLDKQIRTELAALGQWEQRAETLKLIETVFMEPSDDGLSNLFNEFWKAWQELSKNAENIPIRTSLVETAVSLADALNHAHAQLSRVVEDLEYTAGNKALQVNTLAKQIADLNKQISTIQLAGDSPNDLKDKRDLLLDELGKLVNFEIEENMVIRPVGYKTEKDKDEDGNETSVTKVVMGLVPDGQVRIYLGKEKNPEEREANEYLVHVNSTYREAGVDISVNNTNQIIFNIDPDDSPKFQWVTDEDKPDDNPPVYNGTKVPLNDGQLFGILGAMDQVKEYIGDLNDLAKNLAVSINNLHTTGVGLDGSTGLLFFKLDDALDAAESITLNKVLIKDITKIAASAKYFEGQVVNKPLELGVWRVWDETNSEYFNAVSVENEHNGWKVIDPGTGNVRWDIRKDPNNPGQWNVLDPNDETIINGLLAADGDGWTIQDPDVPGTILYRMTSVEIDAIVIPSSSGDFNKPLGFIQQGSLVNTDADFAVWDSTKLTWDNAGGVPSGQITGRLKQDSAGNWMVLNMSTGKPVDDHNGGIALEIAKLRPNTDRQYDQLVSRIGVKTNEARRRTDGQEVLVGQLEARKEGISGVSLDEEMAMMLQYQRIYQASATMINTLDEMIQTILSMKR